MVATSAGLAPLRRSGLTLLSSRVGLNAFSHEMGDFPPNLLLRPGRFRIEMVFLNAQLFRRCLIIAEQLNVLVMGRGSSTRCSRKHSQQAWWLVRALHSSLVPATTLEGMRKVKHLMVNMAPVPDNAGPIYWAIVYVPQGTTPGVLNIDSTAVADMYEPNQFVMNCGIVDPTAGPIRFSSPVSRNLNNGDSIALLLRQTSTNTMGVDGTVRYAITLN